MPTHLQNLLKAAEEELARHGNEASAILTKSNEEKRDLEDDERADLEQHLRDIETLKVKRAELDRQVEVEKQVNDLGNKFGADQPIATSSSLDLVTNIRETKTIGQLFVESEQFKRVQQEGGQFSTGPIELSTKAGTLFEGAGAPGTGQGGGFLTVPDVVPGYVPKLFQRLTVADILPTGTTSTNTIRYVVEGTATSGAAGVAEGGTKPASDLAVSTVDEPVKKIATVLTVSDEMLEDSAQVESYINGRLSLFVRIEEERQLVLGAGTNELVGITGRSGVNTYAAGTVDNNAVALFKAINGTRGSALLEPDYIIMHPTNWQTTRLLMDANNQFYGGGPFQGPYGAGQQVGPSGQVTGADDFIWNKPVIVTTALGGAGTALVGCFNGAAQLFRRSALTVEASNSHASYFTSNLVAIRAEERLALAVYRPSAFTKVTGLS